MEQQVFDKAFEELLKSGNRHDIANYRNCIIEELRTRPKSRDIKKTIETSTKAIDRKNRGSKIFCFIWTLVYVALVVFCFSFGKKCYYNKNMPGLVFFIIVGIYDFVHMILYGREFCRIGQVREEFRTAIVIIPRKMPIITPETSDIYAIINHESENILKLKKEKLDKILGF